MFEEFNQHEIRWGKLSYVIGDFYKWELQTICIRMYRHLKIKTR
jgi:hypothetical protein